MAGNNACRTTRRHRRRAILIACTLVLSACNSTSDDSASSATDGERPPSAKGGVVRISEVNYHSPLDDPAAEYVELANIGDQAVQLQGWCIKGTKFCFAGDVLIEPGSYIVVRQSEIDGTLANDADHLVLVDALGQSIDEIDYTETDPWPEEADGGGLALHRVDFGKPGADVTAWAGGPPTPLAAYDPDSALATGDVVITEINYNPADGNPAAVYLELLNTTTTTIDATDWCLEGAGYCFTEPTTLAPAVPFVVAGVFGTDNLSHQRDRVRIVDPDGGVHDTVRYEDSGQWPALADGHGQALHRRNPALSGTEPGNWDAAPPSPGQVTNPTALLPTFDDVEFTIAPDPDTPITVTATVADADEVSIAYVVGFGPETVVPVTATADGALATEIPAQASGSLVRFRLIASSGSGDQITFGTWPRSGDGAAYEGTVVTDPAASPTELQRLQWFMPDELYKEAYSTNVLQGNDGFPAVIAHDGIVFDNVTIRVKGNQARTNAKRKWKVMLPAGHEWDAGGLIDGGIDQFDLLPAATDKSFSREILVSDIQDLSGGVSQQVFPMRVELNNKFYGLYMYGESPDGGWRERQGLSDETYVWKVDGITKLRLSDLDVAPAAFDKKFERITMTYLDDNDVLLRDLVAALNGLTGDDLVRFAYEHIDIPQVVEAIATMRIVQHSEWQHKNYYVMYDPLDQQWRLVPIDFDLTFGRFFRSPCGARCDDVSASPFMEYPNQNKLARVLLENDTFRAMVDRRTRTLAEQYLAPAWLETRMAELLSWMQPDSELDRARWNQYGAEQTMAEAQQVIIDNYVVPKRNLYLGSDRYLPGAQPAEPNITVESIVRNGTTVVSARLVNAEVIAIDVSGRTFTDIGAVIPSGVVIPAGGAITVVFERGPVDPGGPLELTVVADRTDP